MRKRVLPLLFILILFTGLLSLDVYGQTLQTDSADVSKDVLHLGGLLPAPTPGTRSKRGGASNVTQVIYNGLMAWETTIDISEYQIPTSDIASIYRQVLNAHPELFFVTGSLRWSYLGSYVYTITPVYDTSYTTADVTAYESTVQRIIGMVGEDLE